MSKRALNNKVALVTGASSGMGRAISLAISDEGAKIVCCDLRAEANPQGYEEDIETTTSDLIVKRGGHAIFHQTDLSVPKEVENAFAKAISVCPTSSFLFVMGLPNPDGTCRNTVDWISS
jgi:NAD(P)-dependent dehydrogenase (short-subunit alcohol dehydrogenase family)